MARPEDLKDNLVLEICHRLPCRLDQASMAATCRTWEAALTRNAAVALLRQLPVLFFPSAEGRSFSCLSCGGALHDLALLPNGITEARLIGSRPSWWWFAATGFLEGHVLSNMATGQQIQVPDSMRRGDNIDVV